MRTRPAARGSQTSCVPSRQKSISAVEKLQVSANRGLRGAARVALLKGPAPWLTNRFSLALEIPVPTAGFSASQPVLGCVRFGGVC